MLTRLTGRQALSIAGAGGLRLGVNSTLKWPSRESIPDGDGLAAPPFVAPLAYIMSVSPAPRDLQALRSESVLRVVWSDREDRLAFRFARGECQCAQCVNEWTGARILDPATIPLDITVERMELVGAYAVRIHWSDGHQSGLYTWERLRKLGEQAADGDSSS